MGKATLITFREAAALLDVRPNTIGDLAKNLGIKGKSVPYNGNAKGLDARDLRRIRRALGQLEKSRA